MKKILLFVMCFFLIAFVVEAQTVVTIVNPSFELPDDGAKIKDPNLMDGWHSDITDGTTDSGREANASAPDGLMIGYARNIDGRIFQAVDKLTASETAYTFTISSFVTWAPAEITASNCVTYFSVMDEGAEFNTRVVVDSLATPIDNIEFQVINHTYVFPAGHSYAGKTLLIEYAYGTEGGVNAWAGFDDLHLTKTAVSGVDDLIQSNLFNVYPNPATDNCVLSASSAKPVQFTLYSSNGKAIKSGSFTKSYNLDLSGLNKGIYMFKVNGENKTELKKIVIR
jgi:hypothetical protein